MRAWMVMTVVAVCLLLGNAGLAGAQPAAAAPEEFVFYGLRFGMSPEEVRKVYTLNAAGTEAVEPGHGMRSLQLTFDYRNRLSEIRAAYERPAEGLREAGLRQALKERFIQPIPARWRTVTASLDESFNRAAITLVLVSQQMRQETIEHFRDEYLRGME
ncbi:MAG: hypothetical protein HY825_00345 [Acidobacteria bacterium]|nr:hypothetical protein [Acidobacteriota bacterium]